MKKMVILMAVIALVSAASAQKYTGTGQDNTKEILNNKYATGLFKSADGTILDVENENVQAYLNILDWLDGRVAGLQVYTLRTGVRIPVIRGSIAQIYVDEIRTDASFLNAFSVNDIAMVKVIKSPFAGAAGNGGGGVIAIYTTRAEEEEEIQK
jgi:hypothetical protein